MKSNNKTPYLITPIAAGVLILSLTTWNLHRSAAEEIEARGPAASQSNTGAASAVPKPADGDNWTGPGTATVAWNVAGMTGNGINNANVNILISTDEGPTFPSTQASGIRNNGSSPGNGVITDTSSYTFAAFAEDDHDEDLVIPFVRRESDEPYRNRSAWVSDAQEANISSTLSRETWASNFALPQPGPNLTNRSARVTALIDDMAGDQIQRDTEMTADYHQVYHWTAGSYSDGILHNDDMYWDNPANWSPNGVPGSDDIVNLDMDHVVRSTAPRTVYGFNMSTGALDFDNPGHSLTIGESGVWSGGALEDIVNILPGVIFTLSGNTQKRIGAGGVFNNQGTVMWTAGTLNGYQNSTFNNKSGGSFIMSADGDVFSQYSSGNVFNNKPGALFIKSGNSAAPDGESLVDEWTFNNDGTIRSDIGILRFNTVLNLNGGGSISRNGTSSAMVRSTQHFTLTGTTSIINITFEAGSDWHGNTDPGTAGNGTIATSGGGVFDWTSGTVHNTVNIAAGSTFTLTGADLKQIGGGAVLNNYGNASWSGTGDFQGYQNSTFYNHPDATFSSTSDADFVNYSSGNEFVNMAGAIFQKTAGMENNRCDWAFNNHGTVLVSSGALASNNGGTSSGTFAPTGTGYVQFTGGTHSLITTAKIQGTGKTQILGGVVIAVNPVNAASTATTLDIAGGTLTSAAAGSFTAIGTVNWTGGEIGGTFNVQTASQIRLTTGEIKQIATGGVIHNSGAATWEGPGLLRGYQNSTWINKPGSSFTVLTDGDVFGNYSSGNVFNNEPGASFIKSIGADENSSYIDEWSFNNNGTVQSQQGTLHFNTILNLNVGSTFAGAGRILLDGTTNLNTSLSSAGNPELVGTLNATEASFSGSNPFVWSSGEINGAFTLVAGSVMDLISGNIKQIGSGGVIANFGRINWRLGLLRGYQNSTLNNESGAVFDATVDGDVFGNYSSGNVFNNKAGALFIKSATTGGSTVVDEWTFNNSSSIRSDAGLLHFNTALDLRDGGSISRNGNVSARILSSYNFLLTGTTTVSNVTFETVGDWHGNTAEETTGNGTIATQSNGVFEWTGGTAHNTVNIAPGSTFSISGNSLKQISGVLNNRGIATRTGNGELRGYQNSSFVNHSGAVFNVQTNAPFTNYSSGNRLFNSGVLNIGSPIGVSPLHWGFTQTATGRLNVDIGGPVAATPDFDQFNISGDAVLAGSVGVTLVNAYAPSVNTEFPILTFGSRSGSFSSVSGIGSFWSLKYEADRVSVVSRNLPTNFTDWANYFFEDSLPVENLISGDPDHDGLTNLAEYAFGLNPHAADAAPTTGGILPVSGSQYLTLTYNRPAGSAALTDITYMGERSSSMVAATWFASGVITHSVTLLPGGEEERVVIRSTEPIESATNDFLHLKVIKSD